MFDNADNHPTDDDDRKAFDRLMDAADDALAARGEPAMGEAETGLIEDWADTNADSGREWPTADEVARYIIDDRANRRADGFPESDCGSL